MKPGRSLHVILFTDIVSSTKRATELGDRGWGELLQEHHHRVRREIRRFGGREIKALGDGFLASFPSPSQAIRCAWAIRESTRELGLEVRAGIHVGEVEQQGGDLSGIAVHICSRIATGAAPGEILVSNAVRELETGSGFRFQDRGKHELKGVAGEWRLFALESLPAGTPFRTARWVPELTGRQARIAVASILGILLITVTLWAVRNRPQSGEVPEAGTIATAAPGIAVLPFTIQGEGLEVMREGMVSLLSTGLDGAGDLRTIAPATVFARYREQVPGEETPELPTALEIARRTGARYALIGSAVSVGSTMRVVATVYDVSTGEQLGQGQVEGSPDNVLPLVDRLGVDVLRIILQRGEKELPEIDMASLTTESPEALTAYLEGEVHLRHFDLEA
ncbi:MAG TPA: adenylate/guanylate cyclase domain-containing protein, partial [Gemmatimonadota bacterium]|nr:adenylate/guanylate cyclase domain-containing protein [Gemmatimonadota bacterium]